TFLQNGASALFTNSGTLTLPIFDTSTVSAGTFVNYGQLTLTNSNVTVPSGVTLSESGTIGSSDTIASLNVIGTLRHENRKADGTPYTDGLSITVSGDVNVSGSINVIGRGLYGAYATSPPVTLGETYVNGVITAATPVNAAGSHGGLGG